MPSRGRRHRPSSPPRPSYLPSTMRSLPLSLYLTALCLCPARIASPQATPTVDSAVSITMRDGVVLRADVLRPSGPGRFPVLVYRTPYDRADAADATGLAKKAVQRGYAVVVQDVRGRYGSDGTFTAYSQEGKDGYDTIEWAAQQPWSNGAVGSFGLSYPGAVQWLAAVERPPSLKAMVPAMTYATPETFWYSGGVWDGSWLDWTWFNIAPDLRRRLGVPGAQTSEQAATQWETDRDRLRNYRPLSTLPDFEGVAPWYYEWMRHPPRDSWWKWATLEGKYSAVSAAVLNISGWFDEPYGPFGAVTNYQGLVTSRDASDPRTKLILGAWTHGVAAVQREKAGDRLFGSDAAIDYDETVLRWMDRYLKNAENGLDSDPSVRVFVMGSEHLADQSGLALRRNQDRHAVPRRERGFQIEWPPRAWRVTVVRKQYRPVRSCQPPGRSLRGTGRRARLRCPDGSPRHRRLRDDAFQVCGRRDRARGCGAIGREQTAGLRCLGPSV